MSEAGAGRPQIVCLLPARNAAPDLSGWFESIRRFADAVVALDDGSTDDTGAILAAEPLVRVLLSNPRRDTYRGWDDGGNRRRLLEAAAVLDPRWIMFLDADERLDEVDGDGLRQFVESDAIPGFAYGFRVFQMVGDGGFRDQPRPLVVFRLFAFEPDQQLPDQRLHFVPIPTSVPKGMWLETSLRIQHLGGSTRERRTARYAKYEEADPGREFQADYSHLLEEPSMVLAWQPRPPSVQVLMPRATGTATDDASQEAPVLSVVIIAHDDRDTISASIGAAVEQTVPVPFEVIVVTSGSDRTAEVVRNDFPQVSLVALAGTALPGQARNAGLRIAKGEYVSFPGSHVQIHPGSLAARVAAHDKGYAMVTGTTLNGNATWAGTAAYFLDNSASLHGRPSAKLSRPPAHCSYRRDILEAIGGFPEDMRAGEDTVVNQELWRRGYNAYRAKDVWLTHRSPCQTTVGLVAHYFIRGRAMGRIMLENRHTAKRVLDPQFARVLRHGYLRLRAIEANVRKWGDGYTIGIYRLVRPLVAVGVMAEWVGVWREFLLRRGFETEVPGRSPFSRPPVAAAMARPAERWQVTVGASLNENRLSSCRSGPTIGPSGTNLLVEVEKMSREELVAAYTEGRISRRTFIRGLVAAGVTLSAAATYSTVLSQTAALADTDAQDYYHQKPEPSSASQDYYHQKPEPTDEEDYYQGRRSIGTWGGTSG